MIRWMRKCPGEYFSEDGRFQIRKAWDRVYTDHWQLQDRNESDRYKGRYIEASLMDCKLKAESIVNQEERERRT